MRILPSKFVFMILITIGIVTSNVSSSEQEKIAITLPLTDFLVLGPIDIQLPALNDERGTTVSIGDLLQFDQIPIDRLHPEDNKELLWGVDKILKWTKKDAVENKLTFPHDTDASVPKLYYAATYINTNRWSKAQLNFESCQLLRVYLNGNQIASKTTSESFDKEKGECLPGSASADVQLERGTHQLIIKTIWNPESNSGWDLNASIKFSEPFTSVDVAHSISPLRYIDITNVLEDPRVSNVQISPNGEFAAVTVTRALPPTDQSESWIEIYRTRDGALYQTYRGGTQISGFAWSPDAKSFSYVQRDGGKTTLWIVSFVDGSKYALLEDISNFTTYQWSPTGKFIIYSITERATRDPVGVRRVEGLPDRWPWWQHRSYLYQVAVPTGVSHQLTAGELTTNLNSISPDGKKIIFSRTYYDLSERPFTTTQFFILDLSTMSVDSLYTGKWSASAQWSPDGKKILFTGGPSFFDEIGINVSEGQIPNEYDTQAYIYDLASGNVEPITRNFNPSISSAYWVEFENTIYFTTIDKSYERLYKYDIRRKRFNLVDLKIDIVGSIDFAKQRPYAVFTGENANEPPRFYFIDLSRNRITLLNDPIEDTYRHIKTGNVEPWTFTNKDGVEIDGIVYYPPDFDPDKKYPLIVYYYGGTTPVSRAFEGRYPRNYWASHGYITYVPQPSGAIGYGQRFSSLHVNDWGKIVAGEIIDGVQQFLDEHPYVDRERIGAIGASFGGFMTMYLLTKTDMFTTAVAHAGISSIASYWGQGFWGYLYSAVATAESYPWNRHDIYIERSSLYYADKINTPLLLTHGKSDTNVPVGESIQLYTALKLLGREVEYIEVEEQDHHIMQYSKRKAWTHSIISWFDRWLKDEPEWWEELHGGK